MKPETLLPGWIWVTLANKTVQLSGGTVYSMSPVCCIVCPASWGKSPPTNITYPFLPALYPFYPSSHLYRFPASTTHLFFNSQHTVVCVHVYFSYSLHYHYILSMHQEKTFASWLLGIFILSENFRKLLKFCIMWLEGNKTPFVIWNLVRISSFTHFIFLKALYSWSAVLFFNQKMFFLLIFSANVLVMQFHTRVCGVFGINHYIFVWSDVEAGCLFDGVCTR